MHSLHRRLKMADSITPSKKKKSKFDKKHRIFAVRFVEQQNCSIVPAMHRLKDQYPLIYDGVNVLTYNTLCVWRKRYKDKVSYPIL